MSEARTELGSYTMKQLLLASPALGVGTGFLSPSDYVDLLADLYKQKFSQADILTVISLVNETR